MTSSHWLALSLRKSKCYQYHSRELKWKSIDCNKNIILEVYMMIEALEDAVLYTT